MAADNVFAHGSTIWKNATDIVFGQGFEKIK